MAAIEAECQRKERTRPKCFVFLLWACSRNIFRKIEKIFFRKTFFGISFFGQKSFLEIKQFSSNFLENNFYFVFSLFYFLENVLIRPFFPVNFYPLRARVFFLFSIFVRVYRPCPEGMTGREWRKWARNEANEGMAALEIPLGQNVILWSLRY